MKERWLALALPLAGLASAFFFNRVVLGPEVEATPPARFQRVGSELPPGLAEPLVADAYRVLQLAEKTREQRFRHAIQDPDATRGELRKQIAAAKGTEALAALGRELFLLDLPGDSRIPGHSANRCAACHARGHIGGAGGLVDDFLGGLNPPALDGVGLLETAAAEITADLATIKSGRLRSHGIDFGTRQRPEGIATDFVVRPFGRRGTWSRIDEAVEANANETLGEPLSPSDRGALTAWIRTLPPPTILPPDASRLTDLFSAYLRGRSLFETIGCADCHVPAIVLRDGTSVRAFSDLKRHQMGDRLLYKGSSIWLTTPLWGVGASPPYLHDGHALSSLDAAIAMHGGEADASSKRYAALGSMRQGEIKVFLLSLVPEPQFHVAGE